MTPQRLTQALRAWAGRTRGRRAYGDEVAGLTAPTGACSTPRPPRRAAVRRRRARCAARGPGGWGATPVFFYGFDDLTPLQRDAVQTLAATDAP